MNNINIEILKLAREARCVSQEELAARIGIEQGTLSKIEKGLLTPDPQLLQHFAAVLDYPTAFFCQERRVIPVEGHYRRKFTTTARKMRQYVAQMTIAEWHFTTLLDEIDLPELKLPKWNIPDEGGPELCARFLREYWRIPNGRITSLVRTIEDKGVVVIALDLGELDGFSTWFGGNIPVIFVNKSLPPDRYRLTVAHELAHLILHFGNKVGPDRDVEAEAYAFAIELLVPENNIRPYFSRVTIEKLADLKAYWYVSMAALLKYANTLGMVTGNQYRYLWTQMGTLGYRKKEPVNIPVESPGIVNEMVSAYLDDLGYTREELAAILHMTVTEFEQVYQQSGIRLKAIRNSTAGQSIAKQPSDHAIKSHTHMANKNEYFIERREEGDYAVRKPNSDRASAVEPTQEKAIERAKEMNPNAAIHVERVRHTDKGYPDKWRKA
ncbi:MAG TPA: ImmA/IrrE family metallo-endopeptidase [Puia sp.]|nr:ImmA/IrrE family metallo-endopeptidase [Puia sp.]